MNKLTNGLRLACAGLLASTVVGAAVAAPPDVIFNDGRYIIHMRAPGVAAARALGHGDDRLARGRGAAKAAGGILVNELSKHGSVVAVLSDAGAARLKNDPDVELIEPDPRRYPKAETKPYGISMVQADDPFFDTHQTTSNVMVCIIDSGYQAAHEDLADVLATASTVTGTQNLGTGNWYEDSCGHGSHVAGTIAALQNGVGVVGINRNGKLNLHIQKVFNGSACLWAYASELVSAVDNCVTAAQQAGKWAVISMSLGGTSPTVTEEAAFQAAYAAGHLSVAAAGNDGNTTPTYPAAYDSVMSVGAVDATGTVAYFSTHNPDVESAAPGVDILSPTPFVQKGLTANGKAWTGSSVTYAAAKNVTGVLVDGGYCDKVSSAWLTKVVLCRSGSPTAKVVTFATKLSNVKSAKGLGAVFTNDLPGALSAYLETGITSTLPAITLNDVDGAAARLAVGTSATLNNTGGAGSGYQTYSGTSMATPHVSGVAALIWSQFPNRSAAQVRQALDSSAADRGPAGRDVDYGYGIVQAKAAYDALAAMPASALPPPPPPLPTYTLAATSVAFGTQGFGDSVTRSVTVTNTGTVNLPISSVSSTTSTTGAFTASHDCGVALAVGASCSLLATFKPTTIGSSTGTATFTPGGGASAKTITLSGSGALASYSRSTTLLAYGSVKSGTVSASKSLTLTNNSTSGVPITVTAIGFGGANPAQFRQTNSCGAVMTPGASCVVNISFAPTVVASSVSATVTVTTTGGALATSSINLTGTGT